MVTKVAIVGSEEKYWTPEQRERAIKEIKKILLSYCLEYGDGNLPEYRTEDAILISGGCPKGGVDIWAEVVADTLKIKKDIKRSQVNQWKDKIEIIWETDRGNLDEVLKGYMSRNMDIVKDCDVLYTLDPAWRAWSGGMWTANYAEKCGKEVHWVKL